MKIFKWIKKVPHRSFLIALLSSVPVIILLLPMLLSGEDSLFEGDFDMQVQMTEAAKITILEYKQFPFWNPWIAGGVPLFADPQFGLITPQTLFSFFVDSAYAWKLTIATYFIIGFFSMRRLALHLMGSEGQYLVLASLISYLWISGSFFTLRAASGHFTFLLLTLLPLAIYLLINLTQGKKYFILLTLLLAYCINAAMHYSTILILLTLCLVALLYVTVSLVGSHGRMINIRDVQLTSKQSIDRFKLLILAIIAAIMLNSYRLYQTLEYINDSSADRSTAYEPFIGIYSGIKAIFYPFGTYDLPRSTFGTFEATNYIGTVTVWIILLLGIYLLYKFTTYKESYRSLAIKYPLIIIFSIITVLAYAIGLAGEPYALLRELPIMSSMRVSTRYFFISAFAIITLLALLYKQVDRKKLLGRYTYSILAVLTLAACTQTFYHSYKFNLATWVNNSYLLDIPNIHTNDNRPPKSETHWRAVAENTYRYHALTEGTKNHRVQVIADNALVDTRSVPTQRCDEDSAGCSFILTNNADIVSWSPNEVVLKRSGPGDIMLNINQSVHWRVNGNYIFNHQKVVDSNSTFTITEDSSEMYTITYSPLAKIFK